MNYYEKNMECIKKNRPFMYKSMKQANFISKSNKIEEIQSINTLDGEQTILIKFNNNEYRLNSIYSPIAEANKWVDQFEFHNLNNIISMFGLGNGIVARTIIEKMGENDTLLIYEPCADIFLHVMNNYNLADILADQRVSISVDNFNEFEFHNSLRATMNITNMSDQIMCVCPQYDKIFTESCVLFWKELKDTYHHTRTNINTEIFFGKRFIDNILNNIKFIKNSNTLIEVKENIQTSNLPAIIVSAGPSVEYQIDDLKRAKGKAVIFAVDRILDYLLDSGVEPDFIVTLDPIKPIEYFSKRVDIKIPLLCFLESNQEILEYHIGRKIICNCTDFLENIYKDLKKQPPKMNSSASVATMAFSACIELGFKTIILSGQDLAYDGDQSHAGGVEEKVGSTRDVMLEGVDGHQIKSRYDWKELIIWFQDMIMVNSKIKVIDAKDKGAKIKGTMVMPLKEAVNLYCTNNISCESILDNEPTFDIEEMKEIRKYLDSNLVILEKIKSKSKDAIKACNTLIKESKKNKMESYIAKDAFKNLSKINRYISKQPIYSIMDPFIVATSAQHLLEIYQFSDDINEDSLKTYEKSICVFDAILEAADYIRPKLEKAIDNIDK